MRLNARARAAPIPERAESPSRPTRRLLHTSDLHVDDAAHTHRVLRAVVDVAIECRVDMVLFAGDLFDHARITRHTVAEVTAQLARIPVPTVLIPGNHDCTGAGSLYERVDLRAAGPHISFLCSPIGEHVDFEDLGISVWGRGLEVHSPDNHPLQGFTRSPGRRWQVALAHGHYFPAASRVDRSSPIREEELAGLDCDYVALGHWHHFVDVSVGRVRACYSGSPSDGSDRTVSVVELDAVRGIRVEQVPLRGLDPV